jgi:alkylation response protein AidB-like acyl-CoA dehydrogenase
MARPAPGGPWRLQGRKSGVCGGDSAALLIVIAAAPQGPTLFAVESGAAGLQRRPYRMLDGRGAAHLQLTDALAEPVGTPGGAAAPLMRAWEYANAMLVADSVGAAEALLELTAEHLRTRTQFGKPLAAQQALQHRLADQLIALEQLQSMACVAAMSLQAPHGPVRTRSVSAARTLASQWGRRLALEAIQLHGAMGMTEECAVARYAKRLLANGALLGDAGGAARRFAESRLDRDHEGESA